MFEDDDMVFSAVSAGAVGYLLKGAAGADIVTAVRAAGAGHAMFGAGCRRRPRSHATSDPRLSGWYGGRPRRSLICCWMTSGAGRASTV
jgi:DNA-binding NarL/FixJ family response regulator